MTKTSATNSVEFVVAALSNGDTRNSLFARSRLTNETPIAWLERLCDEHNAPMREQF